MQAEREFGHSAATRAGMTVFLLASVAATVFAYRLPLGMMSVLLAIIPLVLTLFAAYRLYLSTRAVVFLGETVELRHPWETRAIRVNEIRNVRFDAFPHDLVVGTASREYRIPRTVEGFQRVHEMLLESAHLDAHEKLPLEVRVKSSLKWISLFAIAELLFFGWLIISQGLGLFTGVFGLSLVVSIAVFLDQYVLRRCVFQTDGLWVHGLFGRRFYSHADLKDVQVKKTNFWSRMSLDFSGKTVTIEDRVLDLPILRLARIVEQDWGQRVHGTHAIRD